jgi:hypothetical protein
MQPTGDQSLLEEEARARPREQKKKNRAGRIQAEEKQRVSVDATHGRSLPSRRNPGAAATSIKETLFIFSEHALNNFTARGEYKGTSLQLATTFRIYV